MQARQMLRRDPVFARYENFRAGFMVSSRDAE
jgi:hypothetical protein